MKNLKETKTEKNLYKTFSNESRTTNRYRMYAEKARQEGFEWIGNVFDEIAGNEYYHARQVFKHFLDNIKSTEENLLTAAMGEMDEYKNIYKEFEETARREGFIEIADFYKELRNVEEAHKERFMDLYDRIKTGEFFKCKEIDYWMCLNCGYKYRNKRAIDKCPLCNYDKSFFKSYKNSEDV